MNENEIQYHLAAVQGSLPLVQSYISGNNKINVDCVDEVLLLKKFFTKKCLLFSISLYTHYNFHACFILQVQKYFQVLFSQMM